jgi:glyoxylase-like metal-dependent hydrolase (beta-lactamase superfamily II)
MFGGDLLFAGSIGRTDLLLADPARMEESLAKICELDDDINVHPGHGPSTTIGRERATNPFLNGARESFGGSDAMRRSEPEVLQLATLAVWLGAAVFFSVAVAPALFAVLRRAHWPASRRTACSRESFIQECSSRCSSR